MACEQFMLQVHNLLREVLLFFEGLKSLDCRGQVLRCLLEAPQKLRGVAPIGQKDPPKLSIFDGCHEGQRSDGSCCVVGGQEDG